MKSGVVNVSTSCYVPVDLTGRGHDTATARGVGAEAEGQKALLALLKLRLGYVRRALGR